jgi:MFS family permease
MNARQKAAEAALHDQMNLLPRKQLILVFFVLALTLLFMFFDQNGIGQLLPTIAKDLHAAETISWAGTSSLIGNTIFQVLYGRLSDIFGRKVVYLSAVGLLSFSTLMCGLSKNYIMLYVFRGLAGIAGGGITSLSMMIISDIVTLERRGKYQGILGSMVGIGEFKVFH